MKELRVTLVTDGPSDASLIPVLVWLLREIGVAGPLRIHHAEYRHLRKPLTSLVSRIEYALFAYPCDLLFVHRDAEKQDPQFRRDEIETAMRELPVPNVPRVCVVPVRMTEAWLLFDEKAIRRASGNPNGKVKLELPGGADVERLTDPKKTLHELLIESSELKGRRRKTFDTSRAARRVAELLDDFSPLRGLSAFQKLEEDTRQTLKDHCEK